MRSGGGHGITGTGFCPVCRAGFEADQKTIPPLGLREIEDALSLALSVKGARSDRQGKGLATGAGSNDSAFGVDAGTCGVCGTGRRGGFRPRSGRSPRSGF